MFFNGLASIGFPQLLTLFKGKHIYIAIISGITTGISIIIYGFQTNFIALCIFVSLSGLFMGNSNPTFNSWVYNIHNSPIAMGLVTFCTFFTHFLTPYIYSSDNEVINILAAGITQISMGIFLSISLIFTASSKAQSQSISIS